ncbi:TVP38/TMEM64 family protein [Halomonas beimenensis]|uniref:TVP38/TMEM64 family membrane protein n=1 Tax=Halomonas beimenensis TaxID=475662 RepID=A0A291P6S9_9GAMM|nr:TVP38/TMEM64 family protein [Halomonas beimenensis]ATJ82585.1 putative membrane protein YdjX, TVP38/TMEM64 family, SNARE-associated domain [Halomonas beimenensis]
MSVQRRHVRQALLGLLLLLVLSSLGIWLYQQGLIDPVRLERLSLRLGPWGPPMLAAVMALTVVVGPIPTMVVSVAAGMIYHPLVAFSLSMLGALAGAGISFWIARLLGRPLIERLFRGHVALFPECPQHILFAMVLLARLIPVVSFALVSYAAGLTVLTTGRFLLASGLGMAPMTLLYVLAGKGMAIDSVWAIGTGIVVFCFLVALPKLVDKGWIPLPERWKGFIDHLRHPH